MTNMLRTLMEEAGNLQLQMDILSKVKFLRTNQKEIPKIKKH